MLPLILALVAPPTASAAAPQELYNYLGKKDASYAYRVVDKDERGQTIELTSQTWQGRPWKHTILIRQPSKTVAKGTGVLYITGDGPREGDIRQLAFVTEVVGLPVAMLFNVPNQPLWDMKEDDLIAHTFERYLATGDANWPLLFPMTKTALRAMDAVQAATRTSDNPLQRFVVTGASKRGWTTWFVGAARDRRVIGIAPLVYDNLNVAAQMPHQIEQWGKYSEQIEEYTRRGLQAKLTTSEGKKLAQIIDPYAYRSELKVPTLIVIGANDPYWTVDAMRIYWDDLKTPKWAQVVPNAGHDLAGGLEAANTIGAFSRSLAGQFKMPETKIDLRLEGGQGVAIWDEASLSPHDVFAWTAGSESGDFRLSKWSKAPVKADAPRFELPDAKHVAAFVEIRYRINGRTFGVSSPPKVLR
jgi:PhoPQ-activated pathogenicity-related protein